MKVSTVATKKYLKPIQPKWVMNSTASRRPRNLSNGQIGKRISITSLINSRKRKSG